MNVTLIAERYAKALFEMALEKNALEDVNKDVLRLAIILQENKSLRLFLRAPIINPGKKRKVMDEIIRGFNPVTVTFINLLIAKRRERTIPEITIQFIAQYNSYKNIIILKVVSAVTMSEDLKTRLISMMAGFTGANIEINEEIDPSVIGGFVLSWDDKQYDASILKQLERMRKGVARINLYVKGIDHGRH